MRPSGGTHAASFPGRYARTRRFSLGEPRSVAIAPDGAHVTFLRSRGGEDPVLRLWALATASGEERCIADPDEIEGPDHGAASAEEQALRERTRESANGIVAYATDRPVRLATFALSGRLYVCSVAAGRTARHPFPHTVFDPRPDPTGQRVAFVHEGALLVAGIDRDDARRLAGPEEGEEQVSWGLAEFLAAEEMGRTRGYWWSPDGARLAVARVDESPVARWHIADPSDPARPARAVAYPAAGSDNAAVSLWVVDLDGARVPVQWDDTSFPYLVTAVWGRVGPLTLCVQSRDQKALRVLAADPDTGTTRIVREEHDPHWVDIIPGVPRWTGDGRLVHTTDDGDSRCLAVDGDPLTPRGFQVRSVLDVGDEAATVRASEGDPTAIGVWRVPFDGSGPVAMTPAGGVHDARVCSTTAVLALRDLDSPSVRTIVHAPGGDSEVRSLAEVPDRAPAPRLLRLGSRDLRAALLLPQDHAGDERLPVLCDPYGGPHAQRVLRRRDGFLVAQWFADQGFAVLVTDGRGTPGRGPSWERAVAGDLGSAPLQDQIDALHAAADEHPLDLDAVAIRGWSFGGYLAAAAVLRRPDVFHAAIAGAPVTDWRLYDTHYTERYLGTPADNPDAYRASSLLDDAPKVQRPLLLIHGLADDNVVAAHTLRLSEALLGRAHPHQVLPLTGVTHMTPQETVTENLLWLQLAFLRQALRLEARPASPVG